MDAAQNTILLKLLISQKQTFDIRCSYVDIKVFRDQSLTASTESINGHWQAIT